MNNKTKDQNTIKKSDLICFLQQKHSYLDKKYIDKIVELFFDIIKKQVLEEDARVEIRNLGVFSPKKINKKIIFDPYHKKYKQVDAKPNIGFKTSIVIAEKLKNIEQIIKK